MLFDYRYGFVIEICHARINFCYINLKHLTLAVDTFSNRPCLLMIKTWVDRALAMSSANRLGGTKFKSQYHLQHTARFDGLVKET